MGYKIGKNNEGKLVITKETPEEEKLRLESVANKLPVMVPILYNIAANVPAVRKYVEEEPKMREYEKYIPAAQVANFVGKAAKGMLFGNPQETDMKNEINRKVSNNEPLTEEERKYSLEKNMMAVVDMATPTTTPSGASGLDDIARAQNIKNAGRDLTAIIKNVHNTADKIPKTPTKNLPKWYTQLEEAKTISRTSDDYVYHLTSPERIESITKSGLKPGKGMYGNGVYFAPTEDLTENFGLKGGAMLRIKRGNLPKGYDEVTEQGWVNDVVPPKYLEYKEKGSNVWKPLIANKVRGISNKLTSKEILNSKLKALTQKEKAFYATGKDASRRIADKRILDKILFERDKLLK